jgi:hypothetical protein
LPSAQPALFATNNNHVPDLMHDWDGGDLFGPMDDLVIPAGIMPLVNDPHERLRREVELLMMEAEQFDEMGGNDEDDATITNVTEHFHSLRVFHSFKIPH